MKLEIPFSFSVTGVRHGGRRAGRTTVYETAEVDIPEVTAQEAPLAVSWDDRFTEGAFFFVERPRRSMSTDGFAHTVFHDGEHWERLKVVDVGLGPHSRLSPPLTAEALARTPGGGALDVFVGMLGGDQQTSAARRWIATHGNGAHQAFDRIATSGRSPRLAAIRKAAAAYLSVEDTIYHRCEEPCIRVAEVMVPAQSGRRSGALITVDTRANVPPGRVPGNRRFSILETDAAFLVAMEYNRKNGVGSALDGINAAFRPLVDNTAFLDPGLHAERHIVDLYHAVSRAVRDAGEFVFQGASQHAVFDFQNLGADLYVERLADDFFDRMETAATLLHAELSVHSGTLSRITEALVPLLELLENRTVNLSDVANGAPAP